MPNMTGEEAYLKVVKHFQSKEFCDERAGNMEKHIKSISNKFWAIIILILAQAIALVYAGLSNGIGK